MAGLLEKMKSYPQTNRVYLEGAEGDEEITQEEIIHEEPKKEAETKPEAAEPEKKVEPEKPADEPVKDSDQEPPKNASRAEKDAYKERKIKAADEKAAKAERDAESLKKELDRERQEKADWKRQAETVAQRPVTQQPARTQQDTEVKPDIAKDPVGYFSKEIEEIKQNQRVLDQQNTETAASNELAALERNYAEKVTDYQEVMKHAEDTEVRKVMMMNPRANEAQIRASFKADKIKAAVAFMVQGKDPVESLYNLSKVAYGYQPKAAPVAQPSAADKAEADKARFAAVTKNKAKSGSGLSAGGSSVPGDSVGNARTNPLPLKEIAKMSKAEKDAYYREQ